MARLLTLTAPLLLAACGSSGPANGGPIIDSGGFSGISVNDAQAGTAWNWTIQNITEPGPGASTLVAAQYLHVSPGLTVLAFGAINHSVVAMVSFPGNVAQRTPPGTYGPISAVNVGSTGPQWQLIASVMPSTTGTLTAKDLQITYRHNGKLYRRVLTDDYLQLVVTGHGTDERLKDPILLQSQAPDQ